jgi:hypothetical protein
MSIDRRKLLSSGTVAATSILAGCIGFLGGVEDLIIYNRTDRVLQVSVTVVRESDSEEVLSQTIEIPPANTLDGRDVKFRNPIRSAGNHVITVNVKGGPQESYRWNAWENNANGLQINIKDEKIEFYDIAT